MARLTKLLCLGLLVAFVAPESAVARECQAGNIAAELSESGEFAEWYRHLFRDGAKARLVETRDVGFDNGGAEVKDPTVLSLKRGAGDRYFLVMDLNFIISEIGGAVRVQVISPDSAVYLYDSKRNRLHNPEFVGTIGQIHNAIWIGISRFLVVGLMEGTGFIHDYDLAGGKMNVYKIDGEFLRSEDGVVDAYLIQAHHTSGVGYRLP